MYAPTAEKKITQPQMLKSAPEAPDTDETKLSAAEGDFTETGFRLSFLIINENKKHIIKDGNRCAASSAQPHALDEYIPAPTAETAKAGPEFTQ